MSKSKKESNKEGTTGNCLTLFNLCTSYLGSGCLAMPFAFKEAGVAAATVTIILVGAFSTLGVNLLLDSKLEILRRQVLGSSDEVELRSLASPPSEQDTQAHRKVGSKEAAQDGWLQHVSREQYHRLSYEHISKMILGKGGQIISESALVFTQCGAAVVYFIFIASNVSSLLEPMVSFPSAVFWMSLPLCLMCSIRNVGKLAFFGVISQISLFTGLVLIGCYANGVFGSFVAEMEAHEEHVPAPPREIHWFMEPTYPIFLGIAVYAFEGIGLALPIESKARDRSTYRKLLNICLCFVVCVFVVFGYFGYYGFGSSVQEVVTLNLPHALPGQSMGEHPLAVFVTFLLCSCLFFTFPLVMVPAFAIAESYVLFEGDPAPEDVRGATLWKTRLLRVGLIASAAAVAAMFPHFGHVMGVIGGLGSTVLQFSLPALIHLKLFGNQLKLREKILDIFLVVFGLFGGLLAASVGIYSMILAKGE